MGRYWLAQPPQARSVHWTWANWRECVKAEGRFPERGNGPGDLLAGWHEDNEEVIQLSCRLRIAGARLDVGGDDA